MTQIPPAAPGTSAVPNAYKAILRSLMPFIEAAIVAGVAKAGWHINLATAAQVVVVVGGALTVVLHAAESRWPWVGALLGAIGAPAYAPSVKVTLVSQLASEINQRNALQKELDAVYAAAKAAGASQAPAVGASASAPGGPPPNV